MEGTSGSSEGFLHAVWPFAKVSETIHIDILLQIARVYQNCRKRMPHDIIKLKRDSRTMLTYGAKAYFLTYLLYSPSLALGHTGPSYRGHGEGCKQTYLPKQ